MGIHDHAHAWAERGAYLFAGVAVVSLQQAAFAMTCLAGLISAILGCIKIYDRLKHNRAIKD